MRPVRQTPVTDHSQDSKDSALFTVVLGGEAGVIAGASGAEAATGVAVTFKACVAGFGTAGVGLGGISVGGDLFVGAVRGDWIVFADCMETATFLSAR